MLIVPDVRKRGGRDKGRNGSLNGRREAGDPLKLIREGAPAADVRHIPNERRNNSREILA